MQLLFVTLYKMIPMRSWVKVQHQRLLTPQHNPVPTTRTLLETSMELNVDHKGS